MSTKINLPKWGMGLEEGTVVQWLKAIGDTVKEGEAVVEIETAKATQEVSAPASGKLVKITVAAGQTALVNTELGIIEERDE